jgi:dienelactone hydrolase
VVDDDSHRIEDVEFDAEGVILRGWVFRPKNAASLSPVVVMAHGYNCVKELYLDRYAAASAGAGHIVLAHDHRNFGDSEGEPRQEDPTEGGAASHASADAWPLRGVYRSIHACRHGGNRLVHATSQSRRLGRRG